MQQAIATMVRTDNGGVLPLYEYSMIAQKLKARATRDCAPLLFFFHPRPLLNETRHPATASGTADTLQPSLERC